MEAAKIHDKAHSLYLYGLGNSKAFRILLSDLGGRYPEYAPGRFLKNEYVSEVAKTPRPIRFASFSLSATACERTVVEIAAVTYRVGEERAAVVFVDNREREIYGKAYLDGRSQEMDEMVRRFADDVMGSLEAGYEREVAAAKNEGNPYPQTTGTLRVLREIVSSKTAQYRKAGQVREK